MIMIIKKATIFRIHVIQFCKNGIDVASWSEITPDLQIFGKRYENRGFLEVNTKYISSRMCTTSVISSSVLKISEFPRVRSTSEN